MSTGQIAVDAKASVYGFLNTIIHLFKKRVFRLLMSKVSENREDTSSSEFRSYFPFLTSRLEESSSMSLETSI